MINLKYQQFKRLFKRFKKVKDFNVREEWLRILDAQNPLILPILPERGYLKKTFDLIGKISLAQDKRVFDDCQSKEDDAVSYAIRYLCKKKFWHKGFDDFLLTDEGKKFKDNFWQIQDKKFDDYCRSDEGKKFFDLMGDRLNVPLEKEKIEKFKNYCERLDTVAKEEKKKNFTIEVNGIMREVSYEGTSDDESVTLYYCHPKKEKPKVNKNDFELIFNKDGTLKGIAMNEAYHRFAKGTWKNIQIDSEGIPVNKGRPLVDMDGKKYKQNLHK